MKIFIVCSKHHYSKIPEINKRLEELGHIITLPNSFEDPMMELKLLENDKKVHIEWVSKSWDESEKKIKENDAVLVVSIEKGEVRNYIGGATFTEIFMAYRMKKKIFLYNPIPDNLLKDELTGINPVILNGSLNLIN